MSETDGNGRQAGRRSPGIGMVSSLGNDAESSWRALVAGESGAGADHAVRPRATIPVHFACELKDFDPTVWIDRKAARRMDRFAQLVLAAARQAEQDSGIDVAADPERIGASIATGIGGLNSFQDCYDIAARPRPRPRQPVLDPVRSSRTWARAGSRSSSARRAR